MHVAPANEGFDGIVQKKFVSVGNKEVNRRDARHRLTVGTHYTQPKFTIVGFGGRWVKRSRNETHIHVIAACGMSLRLRSRQRVQPRQAVDCGLSDLCMLPPHRFQQAAAKTRVARLAHYPGRSDFLFLVGRLQHPSQIHQ
jgi:hypothetical protein